MRFVLAILGTALLVVVSVSGLRATGEADVLFISSGSAEVGDETTVTLGVAELAGPPVGGWTIDISYDRTVVTATECVALENSVCSPLFDEDTIRSTGASATGLFAPVDFARITFLCDEPGESRLTLRLSVWGDATGIGQLKVELQEGTITCTEPPDRITISSLDLAVGEQGVVAIEADAPGLGAWTIDVHYEPSVVSFLSCVELEDMGGGSLETGVCSEQSAPPRVRVRGASAAGLQSLSTLAQIVFRCETQGATELRLDFQAGGDATIAVPQPPRNFEIQNGTITCSSALPAELPSTGVAEPRSASAPVAVPLAVLGVVLLAALAAFRFRRYASLR